ncbi:MAG: alpha/beta hydrolase [Pseudomonadales bacterium]
MPIAKIADGRIRYEILGEGSQSIVVTPGGRGALEAVMPLGERLAEEGYRVLLHDRRNCGASDLMLAGRLSEQELWADHLFELLDRHNALPVIASGGSAGCRLSLLLALRHPEATRGLLLWSVTGGRVAAERLGYNYYGRFIEAAQRGGMHAVAETQFFAERIAQNPSGRERLLETDVDAFINLFSGWRGFFHAGAELPVIGGTEEKLRTIGAPACVVPVNDEVHPLLVGEHLAELLPDAEVHRLRSDEERNALAGKSMQEIRADSLRRLGDIYGDFLSRRFPIG